MNSSFSWIQPIRWDAPAVICQKEIITYRQLLKSVEHVALNLERLNIKPGMPVSLRCGRRLEDLVLLLAAWKVGCLPCVIPHHVPPSYRKQSARIVGSVGELTCTTNPSSLFFTAHLQQTFSPSDGSCVEVESPALIVLTSGSTGEPKAAVLRQRNLSHNALLSNRNIPMKPDDCWLLSVPLYYVSGLGVIFRSFLAGASVAIWNDGASFADVVSTARITHASLVPTQLHRLLKTPEDRAYLSRLRYLLVGGAPLSENLARRAIETGIFVCFTYGLTEMASQVTTSRPGEALDAIGTCGHPIESGSVTIENGEILVRGGSLFAGYLNNDKITCPLTTEGWFQTGDIGAWDDKGRLRVMGRRDLLFRCGGEFVGPEEIERVLLESGMLEAAVVVPVPDEEYGMKPVAILKILPDTAKNFEQIISCLQGFAAEQLPRHKCPKKYIPWPEADEPNWKPSRAVLATYAAAFMKNSFDK